MKTIKNVIPLAVAVAFFTALNVQAYFDPSIGRWASRDPINEPGFHLIQRQTSFSLRAGEPNGYLFVKNNAENYFDPLGLDIWVISDKSGLIRHREAVGNNADGSYWSSDFGPTATTLCGRINCRGRINFTANQLVLVPTNLPSDYVIESHTVVDQGATDAARDYAKQRSENADQPRYDCCGNNCIDWANGLANYAIGRQLREDLDKIKNEKSQSK
jgi:RHS repeat-associated protein